jgi:hypothetical protein
VARDEPIDEPPAADHSRWRSFVDDRVAEIECG